MGRRPDMVEAGDGGLVISRNREGAPEEELVDGARAAIRIAADEIDVQALKIGGRIGFAGDHMAAEIVNVAREQSLGAVGEGLAHRLGPAAFRRNRDFARRVAFQEARRFG